MGQLPAGRMILHKFSSGALSGWKSPVKDWRPDLEKFLEEWCDDRDFVIGHTSGSTGEPKEIRLYKEDMKASARLTNGFFGLDGDSVLLLSLSTDYIAGKMMVVRALEAGAELWVSDITSHPFRCLSGQEGKVSLAAVVPMQLEETLKEEEDARAMSRVEAVLVGGAPVRPELEHALGAYPPAFYATYGMTETVSHVALKRLGRDRFFRALGKVSFSLDGRGCLVIDAPHLRTGKFVTNDEVRLVDSHGFEWLGRFDNVINSGGIKFFPETIERKISGVMERRFFITAREDIRLGQKMVLAVEGEEMDDEGKRLLLERLRPLVDVYELPKEVVCLPCFRETSSGKVIRRLD